MTQDDGTQKRDPRSIEDTIVAMCAERGVDKTVCPTEVSKRLADDRDEGPLGWRNWLQKVRAEAIGLARRGTIVIYRKGKPVDPDDFRGIYRLGLPRSD